MLGIGGEKNSGPAAAGGILPAAEDVQGLVIPGVGHWVAEQGPTAMIDAIRSYLAPYLNAPSSRLAMTQHGGARGLSLDPPIGWA